MLNETSIKILGLRCSNALLSDEKTDELIANLDIYKSYGVNTVSVFFMGSRFGDIKGYRPDATLEPEIAERMGKIIEAADRRGMIVLVGCLYWSTSRAKEDLKHWGQEEANRAVANTVRWLVEHDYRNVFVDPDNEGMSPWDVNAMIEAAHAVDPTIMVANNDRHRAPSADLNIHHGPKEKGKPWLDSEATPTNAPGGYWGSYSKESHQQRGYYNYSRIGRYTPEMKENQFAQTRDDYENHQGHMLASTWIQCGRAEGIDGPFLEPGGHSEIEHIDADIDTIHPDAGVLWWLEFIQDRYGEWTPPEAK
jgi:hypothetical protein